MGNRKLRRKVPPEPPPAVLCVPGDPKEASEPSICCLRVWHRV